LLGTEYVHNSERVEVGDDHVLEERFERRDLLDELRRESGFRRFDIVRGDAERVRDLRRVLALGDRELGATLI
jgi:hypothetical protein